MKKNILVILFLHFGLITYSQDIPKSLLTNYFHEDVVDVTFDLQDYVETLYIDGTILFNKGRVPKIEKGNFSVIVYNSDNTISIYKSEDLNKIDLSRIKNIKYLRGKEASAYGSLFSYIGLVVIELK